MADSSLREISVAAAVLLQDGKVLVAQRPQGKSHPGLWEFPGGKIRPGETPEACLERELFEELGVRASAGCRLHEQIHTYRNPPLRVHLIFLTATLIEGTPQPQEHLQLRWVRPQDLLSLPFLEADLPFIRALAEQRIPLE